MTPSLALLGGAGLTGVPPIAAFDGELDSGRRPWRRRRSGRRDRYDDSFLDQAGYALDRRSAIVTVSATLSPTYTAGVETAAWIIAHDLAMDLWAGRAPSVRKGTTIHPGL